MKNENITILAIPRGGIVVVDVVAKSLDALLDVVVPRKLSAPHNSELVIAAIMLDGSSYINEYVIKILGIKQGKVFPDIEVQTEAGRRLVVFHGSGKYDLKDKTIVIIDDGIATVATTMVAITWIKKQKT